MDTVALKKSLRKELMARRDALSLEQVESYSQEIFVRWRNRFPLRQIAWMHVFQSMDNSNEVRTGPFVDYLRVKHPRIKIAVPIVDPVLGALRHAYIHDEVEMVKNKWGIPEPKMPVEFVQPLMMDMVLVPLLGFDMKGYRIGYGKGYYDRFLNLLRPKCLTIGVGYECCKVAEGLPIEAHDVPLDFVVTESAVYRLNENLSI